MQANLLVRSVIASVALRISLYIAQVAHMANLIFRSRMHVTMRVVVGASCDTSVRQVTILVDMEAVELAWAQTSEGCGNKSACEDTILLEVNDTFTRLVGLRVHDADRPARLNWCLSHLTH